MKLDLMTAGMPLRAVQQLARHATEAGFEAYTGVGR